MTESSTPPAPATARVEQGVRTVRDRTAAAFERLGLGRVAAGVLLVVLGLLVLARPELVVWILGVGAIVVGVLLLVQEASRAL